MPVCFRVILIDAASVSKADSARLPFVLSSGYVPKFVRRLVKSFLKRIYHRKLTRACPPSSGESADFVDLGRSISQAECHCERRSPDIVRYRICPIEYNAYFSSHCYFQVRPFISGISLISRVLTRSLKSQIILWITSCNSKNAFRKTEWIISIMILEAYIDIYVKRSREFLWFF